MSLYETTFIARQDLSRADVTKLTDSFSAIITGMGGSIVKNEYWGLRPLAYKIKKNRKGHYSFLAIDASPEALKEMERNIRINEDVVRLLTIVVDAHEEGPSAILQSRSGRDDGAPGEDDNDSAAA